jgi:hypothetical protein
VLPPAAAAVLTHHSSNTPSSLIRLWNRTGT